MPTDLASAQLRVMRLYYRLVRIEQTLDDAGGPALYFRALPLAKRIAEAALADDATPRGRVAELEAEAKDLEERFAKIEKLLAPGYSAAEATRVQVAVGKIVRMARLGHMDELETRGPGRG